MANPRQAPRVAEPKEWPEGDFAGDAEEAPVNKAPRRRRRPPGRSDVPRAAEEGGDVKTRPSRTGDGGREQRRRFGSEDPVGVGPLPPLGVLLARPLLLIGAMVGGALLGLVLTATGAYKADAVLEFTAPGTDSGLVRQMGQTLARTAVAADVVHAAEVASGTDDRTLGDRVTSKWVTDTQLVTVSVSAAQPEAAVRDANGIAQAVVAHQTDDTRSHLSQALAEFNAALRDQTLTNPEAEAARRAQLGNSFALRQDAITAQSGQVAVLDAASVAGPAGLTRPMGLMLGAALGLLVAALVSALLGVRGLRLRSTWTLRYLLPAWRIASPSQAAEIAGRIIESRKNAVAVIATEEADDATVEFATDIQEWLEAHGRSVRAVNLVGAQDSAASLRLLRHDVRDDVDGTLGTDLVVYAVNADSKAATLLQGQSNLRALVVARRRRTRLESALRALRSFAPARPVLIVVR